MQRKREYILKTEPNGNRILWIDVAKAIAMILVFYGHVTGSGDNPWFPGLEGVISVIYLFHMPLFFILSGLTFNPNKPFIPFVKGRVKRLIVPYFFFSLYGVVKILIKILSPSLFVSFHAKDLGKPGKELWNIIIGNANGLWFFLALFWGDLVLYIINRWLGQSKYKTPIIAGISTIALFVWFSISFIGKISLLPFQIVRSTEAIGFVGIGWLLAKWIKNLGKMRALALGVFSTVVFALASWWSSNVNVTLHSWRIVYSTVPYIIAAIAGSLVVIGFSWWVPEWRWLLYIGRNTLIYYGLNGLSMALSRKLVFSVVAVGSVSDYLSVQLVVSILVVAIACLVCRIASPVLRRWCWWGVGCIRPHAI